MEKKLYSREVKLKCTINEFGTQGYATHVEYFYCDNEEYLKRAQYKKHFKFTEITENEFYVLYNNEMNLLNELPINSIRRFKL